eukprot:TRINITY_DN55_c0_g2_i3.p1 TRINITY_DN55_c0_g2~~TRINITY_DN55_c0_g2_i3.p1  ORF type:complete len:249 (-),score=45.21 TRINITY_DN55_c0_g2_i3:164-910(-)
MGSKLLLASMRTKQIVPYRMFKAVTLLATLQIVVGHELYPGECPEFNPMKEFSWDKFSSGVWYVTRKFDTKSSCLTYEFKTDNLGFKSVEQIRQLPFKEAVGIDHDYKYTGKLFVPQESVPSKMVVRFPLNAIGSASYVVLDTDYDSYGLLCTCQAMDLFITKAHRISCSILQRSAEEDESVTQKMMNLVQEKYRHDFDKIDQSNCEYDREKAWNIDVDKILSGVADTEEVDYYSDESQFYIPSSEFS